MVQLYAMQYIHLCDWNYWRLPIYTIVRIRGLMIQVVRPIGWNNGRIVSHYQTTAAVDTRCCTLKLHTFILTDGLSLSSFHIIFFIGIHFVGPYF